jgi:hypothetical protein
VLAVRDEALGWVRDIDGRRHSYRVTFRQAAEYALPAEDPDVMAATILRRFTAWKGPRRVTLVRQPNNTVGTRRCGG